MPVVYGGNVRLHCCDSEVLREEKGDIVENRVQLSRKRCNLIIRAERNEGIQSGRISALRSVGDMRTN